MFFLPHTAWLRVAVATVNQPYPQPQSYLLRPPSPRPQGQPYRIMWALQQANLAESMSYSLFNAMFRAPYTNSFSAMTGPHEAVHVRINWSIESRLRNLATSIISSRMGSAGAPVTTPHAIPHDLPVLLSPYARSLCRYYIYPTFTCKSQHN